MSQKNCKFCVVVPFYNEENHLYDILMQLKDSGYPFLFIDDGSTDTGKKIVRDYPCWSYYPNQGKGYAMKYGAWKAFVKGYEYVLFIDSDGQNKVSDISNFDLMLQKHPDAKIIIGNRLYSPTGMPIIRFITNKFMSWIISLLAGQEIKDSQCGMRLCHKEVFSNIGADSNRFQYESEQLIKASRLGMKIINVPIKCIYEKGRKSKIRPIKDTIRFFKMIINILIK